MFKTDGTDRDARDHFLSFQEREIQSMEEGGLILDAVVRLAHDIDISRDDYLAPFFIMLITSRIIRL